MISTRFYILFLSVISVLIIGITWTIASDLAKQDRSLLLVEDSNLVAGVKLSDFTAFVDDGKQLKPVSVKIEEAQKKVLAYRQQNNNDRNIFVVRDIDQELEVKSPDESNVDDPFKSIKKCNTYSQYSSYWLHSVRLKEKEGVRLVYDSSFKNNESYEGHERDLSMMIWDYVVLELPVISIPTSSRSCVEYDVVGVANDGSLIRNNEYSAYGIFGKDTVIGYALDGFPIYGRSDSKTLDDCGGGIGVHGYGYILQTQRQSVLNCYSGNPVSLP